MGEKPKTLILIDGNALVHRAYHALPPLTNKKGESVGAVYGFALTLFSVLSKFKPEYVAASFDLPKPTFRHEKFTAYKATREKAPDDLYEQIPRVKKLVTAFRIPIYEQEGFEADDCIGTLSRMAREAGGIETIIVTGDNDTLQLVDASTKVFALRKGVKDTVLYDEAKVFEKYGVPATRLIEWKGLRGDTSDNIPGVPGVGEKSASTLIAKYETIEGVYEHLDEIKGALQKKLAAGKESAFLSRELATIHQEAPVMLDLKACRLQDFDQNVVEDCIRDFGFVSLLSKIPGNEAQGKSLQSKKKFSTKISAGSNAQAILKAAQRAKIVAFSFQKETGTLFKLPSREVGIAFFDEEGKEQSGSVALTEEFEPALRDLFSAGSIRKIFYDEKSVRHLFASLAFQLEGDIDDVMLAGYLLNPGKELSIGILSEEYLGMSTENDAASEAITLLRLAPKLHEALTDIAETQNTKGKTIVDLLECVELPLVPILFEMESRGIFLNAEMIGSIAREMAADMSGIEKEIYTFSGHEFNISSPKQLAEVLFDELKIPSDMLKRTKTGISTASSELAKLRDTYPIASLVEQYRELTKLKSTYLDVLPALRDSNGRIHTTFHQATTATGRLSSSDPNLQNIPIRSVWGERIRVAFEADPEHVFVGADYSQIELRVAAHLAADKNMSEAFHRGEDIHRATASLVYHVLPSEVTDDMRRKAKVFNFGILYGMGAFGLSQAAGIPQEEAAQFIREYLENFSGIRNAMESMKEFAKHHGYVETELGRRRLLPEITSSNRQIAAAAERMAINMPIQGLEADIVKLAMIAVDRLIAEQYQGNAAMMLQVHDELIFEVREDAAEAFSQAVKRVMESVYPLSVPLVADVSIGKNWGEI